MLSKVSTFELLHFTNKFFFNRFSCKKLLESIESGFGSNVTLGDNSLELRKILLWFTVSLKKVNRPLGRKTSKRIFQNSIYIWMKIEFDKDIECIMHTLWLPCPKETTWIDSWLVGLISGNLETFYQDNFAQIIMVDSNQLSKSFKMKLISPTNSWFRTRNSTFLWEVPGSLASTGGIKF